MLNSELPAAAGANSAIAARMRPRISVRSHDDELPPFAEAELERLYGNVFSLLAYYRLYNDSRGLSTYVVRKDDEIVAVWIYRRERHRVQVINEGIAIADDEAARFASHIFGSYPDVHVISFHAVQTHMQRGVLPFQRFNCLEDMVLALPASSKEYTAALGKSTRSYINRYLNKLRRDYPSFRFEMIPAEAADEKDIRRIIEFNHQRMAVKGKESIHQAINTRRIVRLAQERGMLGVITISGRICAGTINYRVRDNYFLEVLAHDPAYDDYRLGTLCCYLTICECIAQGGGEYHFLWGQDAYKSRLLGVQRDLDDLAIYRSHMHMLRHGGMVCRQVANAGVRRARLWMREARGRKQPVARFMTELLQRARSLKGSLLH